MNILITEENLTKTGVYCIKNIINNKIYIGSTVVSFNKRINHHLYCLKCNSHKNKHLLNAYNKYGHNNFEISILEYCEKEQCLNREQYYLDTLLFAKEYVDLINTKFLELGYNINPLATGTPNLSREAIQKRSNTYKNLLSKIREYYKKYKNLEIDFDDIPEDFHPTINNWINYKPWNKGLKYKSTEHLKVSKTKTDKWINARKKLFLENRNKMPKIEVYDINMNYIDTWNNIFELCEFSKNNNLPIIKKGKIKNSILFNQNVLNSIKTLKPYKGLYFKVVPNE